MRTTFWMVAMVTVAGCAPIHVPVLRLEQSSVVIRSAEDLGANGVPTARRHLEAAKEEQEAARVLANRDDPGAELMLERAEADAEVALVLAREAELLKRSLDAARAVQVLRGGEQ